MDADAFEGSSIIHIILHDLIRYSYLDELYNENMLRQSRPTIQTLSLEGIYNFRFQFLNKLLAPAAKLRELGLYAVDVEYNCRLFEGLK